MAMESWTADDVPPPPYFHGSSWKREVGDELPTYAVMPAEERAGYVDARQRAFADTDPEVALGWACRNGQHDPHRDTLYVYRVDLTEPEVNPNVHSPWRGPDSGEVHSVMAPKAVVDEVVIEQSIAECWRDRQNCEACLVMDADKPDGA